MVETCLVTGANGFIGAALLAEIGARMQSGGGFIERGAVRSEKGMRFDASNAVVVGDINGRTEWDRALSGVSVVVHAAARAHVLREYVGDPIAAFREVNVDGTLRLAGQALKAGVRRFIFISSIGVNGNQTFDRPFTSQDVPNPKEPYAVSKLEAELALSSLFSGTATQLTIVRPPLVYGPNPPGNFNRLLRAVAKRWPLPLGAIHNKRSLIALDNLVDFLINCLDHPRAGNQTFLISDGEDLSTTELLSRMAKVQGRSAHLLPVPSWMLTRCAELLGKPELSQRLCGNLQVDGSKARDLLNWMPPVSVAEGLRRAVVGTSVQ